MKRTIKITALAIAMMMSTPSMADGERESLAKVLHELDGLDVLVTQAEGRSNTSSRIQFKYRSLRSDLAKLRFGIKEYLDVPTIEPRKYAPLSGEFIQ